MDSALWSWAWSSVLDVIIYLFNTAISVLGVAILTLLALMWLYAAVRLIIRPILGMSIYGGISSDIRENRAVAKQRAEDNKYFNNK